MHLHADNEIADHSYELYRFAFSICNNYQFCLAEHFAFILASRLHVHINILKTFSTSNHYLTPWKWLLIFSKGHHTYKINGNWVCTVWNVIFSSSIIIIWFVPGYRGKLCHIFAHSAILISPYNSQQMYPLGRCYHELAFVHCMHACSIVTRAPFMVIAQRR